ncbi:hypothetical protein RS9917_10396 [Synechococcus sp. RS9917]|nr:hypothetical protein RS9917_10396 [Synechococcus sp. RS9917]
MAAMGRQNQHIPHAEITLLLGLAEAESGTAPQHQEPFMLVLVVPEAIGARVVAGVNQLQPPPLSPLQIEHGFGTRAGNGVRQEVVRGTPWEFRSLTPAAADLKSPIAGQLHHLIVICAGREALTPIRLRLQGRHQGIQLSDLVEKSLQIRFRQRLSCALS